MRKKTLTATPMLKCLVVGALEDNDRYLFLIKKDSNGIERIELPNKLVVSGRSEYAEIKSAVVEQTGIDAQIHEVIAQSKHNSGSRKRKVIIPVMIFKVTAKERFAKPSSEYSGFRWLSLEQAKKEKLTKNCEWLLRGWSVSNE